MNILSLFDGISCGQFTIAHHLQIKNYTYYASEIEKSAIAVTMYHYPKTIQLGNVTKIDGRKLPKIDLLIGGSPCQGFSIVNKNRLAFDDPRSKLFFEYVRILKELRLKNPSIRFMLENVRMKKEHENVITKYLAVEPLYIDSAIFSVQSRKRLYWTNIILTPLPKIYSKAVIADIVQPPFYSGDVYPKNLWGSGWEQLERSKPSIFHKAQTLIKGSCSLNIPLSVTKFRKATAIEQERCAGLTDNYTKPAISYSARTAAIGNGWETNTIAWILNHFFKTQK